MKKGKKKSSIAGLLRTLILLVALGVFCYSGYMLVTFYLEYRKSSVEYDNLESAYTRQDAGDFDDLSRMENEEYLEKAAETDLSETETEILPETGQDSQQLPVMTNPIDFAELKKVNPDIRGWLKVRALNISYPVVQGEDNEYYLHRTFEGTENFAGCLFMDARNQEDFSDQNTIIYGHNMKNGSMFGKLHRMSEEDILNKGKFFWVFTEEMIYLYRIISGSYVANNGMHYKTVFTEEELEDFLEGEVEHSQVPAGEAEVSGQDQIVTLSTCTGDESTRFVVIGQLARQFVPKDRAEEYFDKLKEQETESERKEGFWEQHPAEMTWEEMSEQLPVIVVG